MCKKIANLAVEKHDAGFLPQWAGDWRKNIVNQKPTLVGCEKA